MIFVYLVCANRQEAKKIGHNCVEKKLVACANYFPIESIYWWKKKLVKDQEFVLILKTREENFLKVKKLVKRLHSYEIPCITSWKAGDTDQVFLNWVKRETR